MVLLFIQRHLAHKQGNFNNNLNAGCWQPRVPHIAEACFDYNKERAHFYATGQTTRCLKETFYKYLGGCANGFVCADMAYSETPCTCREANIDGGADGRKAIPAKQGEKNITSTA